MMNEFYSNQNCTKMRFRRYWDGVEQATHDEMIHEDKRKVYYCWNCKAYHTSREKVKVHAPLLDR